MSTHFVERLPRAITPEAFRAAFPGSGVFVFEGDGICMMGAEPSAVLRVNRRDAPSEPFAALREHLVERHERNPAFPFPFHGGLVGYVGYECGQMLERLPRIARPSLGMPDLAFGLYRWVLGTRDGQSWLSIVADDPTPIRDRLLSCSNSEKLAGAPPTFASATAWLDRDAYLARVEAAKEHILAGDAFEICLTNAFDVKTSADGWSIFRALRRDNPSPFAAFLDLPEGVIVSSSPERFLALRSENGKRIAETRPIKGTRPRGRTADEDAALAHALATSEKDRAENAMIVDLSRNDLGRVCRIGTVTAPDLYAVESYATVHQLVSTVRGELKDEHDAIDLLRACFPPGSMTGAPKIEAMSILEHLEPVERGPYAGALGWIGLDGTMDLSVVIRSAVFRNGSVRFAAGGAITADSDPVAEYDEMLQKTRAIRRALGIA